jgi:hypothetical protein
MKLSASSQKFNSWKPYKNTIWVAWGGGKGRLWVLRLGLACKSMSLEALGCVIFQDMEQKKLAKSYKTSLHKTKKTCKVL